MGLSLDQVTKGAADLGNFLLAGVAKFNEIRKESAGAAPTTTSAPGNVTTAATTGTAVEAVKRKGTVPAQAATAAGGGNGLVLAVLAIAVIAMWPRGKKGG